MTALAQRRGACPALSAPMQTGDGLLVRLNPVAGCLSTSALIGLCHAAARRGNGIMEITQRGSVQIRGLTPESARLLADDVNALDIAVRTGVPVETSPLAGLDRDEIADPRPLAASIRTAIENAGLSRRLGPKVSVIVDGSGRVGMDDLLADVRLAAMRRDGETLWHLAIGGTVATARPIGPFAEREALATTIETLGAIAALGREGRGRDITGWRTHTPDPGGGALPPIIRRRRLLGTFPLANATYALGIALPFGSMPAEAFAALVQAAANLGAGEIRPAPGRVALVLGLTAESAISLQTRSSALGFVTGIADPRLFLAACPGRPACASGHIETRTAAGHVAAQNPDLLDGSFTLHVSGCAKGCAHPGSSVLTLVGDENGVGLVVNGTAKALPAGYASRYDAARGLGRVAALVRTERRPNETAAACLARLGTAAIATAFAQG